MSTALDGRPADTAGRPFTLAPWAAGLGLAAVALAGLCLGTPFVSPHDLLSLAPDSIAHVVVWELRVPRVLIGLLGGAAIGTAGLLLQESLRNPLAVPEMLGVSTGAALAVSVCVVWTLPISPRCTRWPACSAPRSAGSPRWPRPGPGAAPAASC
ncbi:iron chelate uptake ABC transporter family permease subunit [Nonomuraea thailandensis]